MSSSGIASYSVTPATNATADGGNSNWAENQPPSSVNNTARQNLADLRVAFNDLAWFQYGSGDQAPGTTFLGVPYVYSSASSVQVAGADVTIPHHTGRRMKFVGATTGTLYGNIASSSYSSGTNITTINLAMDSGAALNNEPLTGYLSQIPVTGKPVPSAALQPPLVLNTNVNFAPTNIIDITQNINTNALVNITNPLFAATAACGFRAQNDVGNALVIQFLSSGYIGSGLLRPDGARITGNGAGGLTIGTYSATPLYFAAAGVEIARFDQNGQLGIGMVPARVLDITQNVNGGCSANLTNPNTGAAAYATYYVSNSATASFMMQFGTGYTTSGVNRADGFKICGTGAGGLTVGTNNAQPLYFITNNAEAGRFDAAGNLGIGVAPSYALHVQRPNTWPSFALTNNALGSWVLSPDASTNALRVMLNAGEAARFTTGNQLFVNIQTLSGVPGILGIGYNGSGQDGIAFFDQYASAGAASVQVFYRNGSLVGSISTTLTATAFNTSSDLRLKENVRPAADPGALIDAIDVDQFDWISDKSHVGYGIVAQKLHKVFPDAVTEGIDDAEDGVPRPWMIDNSKLVPLLLAEVQSLRRRVAAQEGK